MHRSSLTHIFFLQQSQKRRKQSCLRISLKIVWQLVWMNHARVFICHSKNKHHKVITWHPCCIIIIWTIEFLSHCTVNSHLAVLIPLREVALVLKGHVYRPRVIQVPLTLCGSRCWPLRVEGLCACWSWQGGAEGLRWRVEQGRGLANPHCHLHSQQTGAATDWLYSAQSNTKHQ